MIIRCQSLGDFLKNIESGKVFRNTVYMNRTRDPVNGPKNLATSFDVYFQASAVLDFGEDGLAFLECGELCGIDRETADGNMEGTERQKDLTRELELFCEGNGLSLLPGVIDQ